MLAELKDLGNKAFANRQFKKAAKIYRDAIKLDPANPVLYSNRALCFVKLEDWDRALRDCIQGLSLDPENKTRVKLLFRKGLLLKNSLQMDLAKRCFEQVLDIDPQNLSAREELASTGVKKHKHVQDIPITTVNELPSEILDILEPAASKSTVKDAQAQSADVDLISKELFPKTRNKDQVPSAKYSFTEFPTMFPLNALKSFSGERLSKAYIYVLDIPISDYQSIFETGIDAEFLEFFLKASTYAAQNNIADWETRASQRLTCFSTMKRFDLSLMMVSPDVIHKFIGNLSTDSSLRTIFSCG